MNQFTLSEPLRELLLDWAKRKQVRDEQVEAALRVARLLDASGNPLAPWGPRVGKTITVRTPSRFL